MQKKIPTKKKNGARREPSLAVMSLLVAAFLVISFIYEYSSLFKAPANQSSDAFQGETFVRFNEVMSANASALSDDSGNYSDWLELYNEGDEPVNLYGWTLYKSNGDVRPLTFPNVVLQPGEYLLIYADGRAQATAGYALHAPFKLTAAGDGLVLATSTGLVADTIDVPSLEKNESYALNASGSWGVTRQYTPGLPNTDEAFSEIMSRRVTVEDVLVISEVMIKNRTYVPDEDGECCDYIELYNASDRAVNVGGYALSDTDANLSKWVLPDITIPADGYLLVYASGKNRTGSNLHTGFKLSDGESVFLSNANGQLIDYVTPETTRADQAWSRLETGFSSQFPPTPGQANNENGVSIIDAQLTASNKYGLYISEVMTSTNETDLSDASYDWVEIYNSSSGVIDLSGIALSDNANRLRKWQFPSGATINPGEYKIVYLTGEDTVENGVYCADFRLSMEGGYSLLLSTSSGELIDRLPIGKQYANISYGRSYSASGLRYYVDPTPKAANSATGYVGRADEAVFSVEGGMYGAGETLTLTLSAPSGSTIFYTTDCSEPDQSSSVYTGPITLSANTIIRTVVYQDDCLPSLTTTQSYFFGLDHTMRVVSLVSDPVNLFDYNEGIYEMGPGATGEYAEYPYGSNNKGANFWMDWEKAANVEVFSEDGETLISQGCGLKLQGQYSRAEAQKAFKLIARSEYGSNRFEAALFDDRLYTEYQSFILRASGQDWDKTRMRDIVQTSLASETDVMYQAAEMCVVYLNGEYWGQYNMRERINKYSICQWEDWTSDPDDLDIIKANRTVMQGSNDSFEEIVSWITENGVNSQEDVDYVSQFIDIDNYLDYVAVEMFVGNPDLLNVKRYRSVNEDGKWRWILFDTDWGFTTDTNSMRRWLDERGAGGQNKTDNRLFVGLMANSEIEQKFMTRFNELMLSSWTADKVLAVIDEYYQQLLPEIDQHLARWGFTREAFEREMTTLIEYASERPFKMLYYIQDTYDFTDDEMNAYFADSLAVVVPQAIEYAVEQLEKAGIDQYLKNWNMNQTEFDESLTKLRSYAERNPVALLDSLYDVFERVSSNEMKLSNFQSVLNAAK